MLDRIREARRNESGFTLIELLIVIVILGVLAGIVVFAVSAFNNDGKQGACKSDLKNVEIASEAYYAKNSVNPPASGPYATGIGAANSTDKTTLVGGGYLKEPPGNNGYTVSYSGGGANAPTITGNVGSNTDGKCG